MTQRRWHVFRIGPLAGAAAWLALGAASTWASSLEPIGEAARPAISAQAESAAQELAAVPVEPSAMYRLPAVDESVLETYDATYDAAFEGETITPADTTPIDVPPSEPWAPSAEYSTPSAEYSTPPAEYSTPSIEIESNEPAATTVRETEPDVTPFPVEPAQELLDGVEEAWSQEFEAEPTRAGEPLKQSSAPAAPPYAPTVAELTRQLLPVVQKAHGLARHGAVYAAQTEFIQVLRRVAQAKDAATGCDAHSQALAAGLRALDEADDFVPQGKQLEGEMNVDFVAIAHRTPVLRERATTTRPIEAVGLYHHYAREQLARAMAGEQAGSAALYGLGKVHNRLAYEAEGELRHERKAMVMFLAALDAVPSNHLAANEVGVLLARAGRPVEAALLFRRAIDVTHTSTSYHNLAVVERKLGYHAQADANDHYAAQLAARERATGNNPRSKGVQWVAPQELSRVAQPMPLGGSNDHVTGQQRIPQPAVNGPVETAAKWPQKLVPGIFRR